MEKRKAATLTVRICGLILVLNGFRYLIIIFENVMMASGTESGKVLLSQGAGLISGWVIEAVIYFITGLYFLRAGNFIIDLLDYDAPPEIGKHRE